MVSVSVNPPKTPITKTTGDKAPATLPNVCKMPGPPAPFVPTPLPNCGQSMEQPSKTTKNVKIEGQKICVKGSYYMSKAIPSDMPSKPQGGGILSGAAGGKTEFVAPGSMNTKAEGKNIQLLGDAMTNNGGTKNTGATFAGNIQSAGSPQLASDEQEAADILCQEMCDAIENGETSNQLEKRLNTSQTANAKRLRQLGVQFRTYARVNVPARFGQKITAFGRAVRNIQRRAGRVVGQVLIKPDAIMGATLGGRRGNQILRAGRRCFEIKLPGDRVGRGKMSADQLQRQAQVSGGRRPAVIGCPEDGGGCIDCPNCARQS